MTVRSWMIVGIFALAVSALVSWLEAFQADPDFLLLFTNEDWMWCGAAICPVAAIGMLVFRRQLAGLILGEAADRPVPLGHSDLVVMASAVVGLHLMLEGFSTLSSQVLWLFRSGSMAGGQPELPGGLFGFYLREVWLLQFSGFLGVLVARFMPRIMRLPPPRGDFGG